MAGFVLDAVFLGQMTNGHVGARSFLPMLALMPFATSVLIHGLGLLQLGLWLRLVGGSAPTPSSLLCMGTVPFIAEDVIKAAVAAALARGITLKKTGRSRFRIPMC